jgi:hypothetical protein
MGQRLIKLNALLCPQFGVTAEQLQLMAQKTMREHPELLSQPAEMIISEAIIEAYRCRPGQTPVYGGQTPN